MFSVISKRLKANNFAFTITPNLNGNKVQDNILSPLSDLIKRIDSRLRTLKCERKNVSKLTFKNFSIDALDTIRRKYKKNIDIKDIFNCLNEKYYDPACIILEEIVSENDLKFLVNSLLARVDFTENFTLLVLRNVSQKCLEALCDIKFPSRLNLRIEHSDIKILEELNTIKLQTEKIEFFVSYSQISEENSKNQNEYKVASNSSSKPEHKTDLKTDEEESAGDSDHDSNRKNITGNDEKDSNEQSHNESNRQTGSVRSINHVSDTSLTNQLAINVAPEIEVSDDSLDTFKIIRTIASDTESKQGFSNHIFSQSLKLIDFVASAALNKGEYDRNIRELKKQIDALKEEIKAKDFNQEKVHALQEVVNILKQDKVRLQEDIANITSGNQSKLIQYVLEASQLREKNQHLVQEVEELKVKLSNQESSNKRRLAEEEGFHSNKIRRVGEYDALHNNNFSQNSSVGSVATDNFLGHTQSRILFFPPPPPPHLATIPNVYSLPAQQLPNNNGVQPLSSQALDTSLSNYSSQSQHSSDRYLQAAKK